jgi:tripartite ATP-independent transporter DctM subunit
VDLVAPYLFLPFLVLLALGVPIAFSLSLACAFFLALSGTRIPMTVLASEMYGAIDSFALLALPTFVLAGELLNRCELTDKLIEFCRRLVGWIRGGLAHVTITASMLLSGITGSTLSDAATIAPIMIPSMIREKYPREFAGAIVASASVVGAIIPPSIPLVIIGAQLGISIGGLLIGGILPGILVGFVLMIASYLAARWRGFGAVHPFEGFGPLSRSTAVAAPVLAIPVLLLGGMMSGVFSPTEAGTVTVLYTVVAGMAFYRTLTIGKLVDALKATAWVTASALIIVAAAVVLGRIMTFHRVPQALVELMVGLTQDKIALLLLVVALFVIVGMFMDAVANMVILGPLLYPLCVQVLEMHPIQYGMFLMTGLLLGVLTPPVGLVLFVVAPIARLPLERLSYAVLPYLALEFGVLFMIATVPEITLTLPRLAGYVK